ncbi:hypothetical protein MHU86_11201 [Fragilaria crotonensis]|nr:hypothetical protein MHU86_11201 [Fragilaria crotonensis]
MMRTSDERNEQMCRIAKPACLPFSDNERVHHSQVGSNVIPSDEQVLARQVLDMRNKAVLNDEHEFRRIKAELRACGATTSFGAMYILNHRLSKGVSQTLAQRRSSLNLMKSPEEKPPRRLSLGMF